MLLKRLEESLCRLLFYHHTYKQWPPSLLFKSASVISLLVFNVLKFSTRMTFLQENNKNKIEYTHNLNDDLKKISLKILRGKYDSKCLFLFLFGNCIIK